MKKKILLLGVAILVIGLVIMPNTISMFKNQHTWQDTNTIVCTSCHADIKAEIESGSNYHHDASALGVSDTEAACKYCHQTQFGNDTGTHGNWSWESSKGTVHAAFSVECLDCHGGSTLNDDPSATNISNEFNATSIEAHKPLYNNATTSSLMEGANEACIACHTGITIQDGGYFVYNYGLNITANQTTGTWIVTFSIYNP
ncbi:MAG: hypothetical protein JSV49_10160 [Thermoplasmata archaeon]|nr:MAG: hypothetical protein JSV49_10160 [Thermoplasmata archaeon]